MKQKNMNKLIGIGMVICAAFIFSGCSKPETAAQEVKATPVAVEKAYSGSLSGNNQLTGTAKAGSDVEVFPKVAGEVIKVEVDNGSFVKKGQVLAKLDDKEQRLAVEVEKARVQQAENALLRAQNGKKQAEKNREQSLVSLKQAEGGIEEAKEGRENNVNNLKREIENVEQQVEEATRNTERMNKLYEEGLISLQQLEQAQSAERQAKLGLDQLKLKQTQMESELSLTNMQTTVEQATLNIEIAEGTIRDSEVSIKDAQTAVKQAQIALSAAQNRLNDTVITAPVSGRVMAANTKAGEFVTGQQPFLRIISEDLLDVEMTVTADQLMLFEIGDVVSVQFAGQTEKMEGTVTYISPAADASRLFAIDVRVNNPDKTLRPGMVATVSVEEVLVADSVIVPSAAIVERQDQVFVFTVKENVVTEREVEVVRYDTDFTAISGDIVADEEVVVKGQSLLANGDAVRIVKEEK
ncbi:efflux RND transporter periplasmic adaptor subunit [Sporosarcina sp. 179-K 3D1 HS]|uniref:efflux RND transporter periplasmic adaptor subunit n=1 Tax=Sporosarcina sp. 179-K 3D1 HS TaxID=3232169 RepID=UPI0039A3935D